jgi:hypothetical protein
MPIQTEASDSTRKSIHLTVAPAADGLTLSGSIRWFDDWYEIPIVRIACVYTDDASYRVALCRHASGPALVLIEDDAIPAGYEEICSPIRWRFTQASDTCESVNIHVTRRVLVPMPTQHRDEPVYEMRMVPIVRPVGAEIDGQFVQAVGEDGELLTTTVEVERQVQVGTRRIEIPPEPLPEPTVHQVSATPVLPQATAERTESRKVRRRIRQLRQECRALKDAGKTYADMLAGEKAKVVELALLTGEPVPMAVPA